MSVEVDFSAFPGTVDLFDKPYTAQELFDSEAECSTDMLRDVFYNMTKTRLPMTKRPSLVTKLFNLLVDRRDGTSPSARHKRGPGPIVETPTPKRALLAPADSDAAGPPVDTPPPPHPPPPTAASI